MNFSPKSATGQTRPIRAEGEAKNALIRPEVESLTQGLARRHAKDSNGTFLEGFPHPVGAGESEQSPVPRKRKCAFTVGIWTNSQAGCQAAAQQRFTSG